MEIFLLLARENSEASVTDICIQIYAYKYMHTKYMHTKYIHTKYIRTKYMHYVHNNDQVLCPV